MTTLLQLSNKNAKIPRNTCVGQQLVRNLFPCHVMSFLSRLYRKKENVLGRRIIPPHKLPWGSHLFIYFFKKRGESCVREKQKVRSTRRVTCLAGSPFCHGRITFLAGVTFLHINIWLTQPSRVNSVKANQSEHARTLLARAKRSAFSSFM